MDPPDIDKVQELTRKLVLDAEKKGTLHTLTPKVLRRQIENELKFEEGQLDSSEYRRAIKETIEATMAEVESGKTKQHNEDVTLEPEPSKTKVSKGKKRTSDTGTEDAPKKKRRVSKKADDTETKKQGKRKGKNAKVELLPSSGEDSATGEAEDVGGQKASDKKPSMKQKKAAPNATAAAAEGSEKEDLEKPVSKVVKAGSTDVDVKISGPEDGSAIPEQKAREDGKDDYKSESELSVLIDEPPKPKRKRKDSKDASDATKSSSKKSNAKAKKSESLSKDEETIKKLKSLVLACGVRKVWSKVFQGLDTPSQQIKKLKEILHELGMTGRMSVEQAKTIKAKREFEQELQDVQEFEKAVLKTERRKGSDKSEEPESKAEADETDEEDNPKPRRRKMNAAQSIMAFLGDQSSDEG